MEPYFSLAFTLFFDLILLVSLVYYYHRLGYRFLKFGAAALAMEMFGQTAFYSSLFFADSSLPVVVGGIAEVIYTALLLACIADMVGRAIPLLTMSAAIVAYLLIVIGIHAGGEFGTIEWIVAQLPCIALLLAGLYYAIRSLSRESIAVPCMIGLVSTHLGLKALMPLLASNQALFDLLFFLNAVVVMLLAVVLLMATSERMIRERSSQNDRLEEYRQQRKRLELQVSQSQKLESLGLLAGGIAHDFNNMLTSILGYSSLVMSKLPEDSEVRKDVYMIMSGARQAVDLTSQMLIYAGKGAAEFQAVDISRVVDNMSSLMNSIVPKKIQLIKKLTRDMPAVRGDKVQLGQIAMNLVANAVDAIDKDSGSVEIETGLAEVDEHLLRNSFFGKDSKPGAYLYLRIQDDGVGMDETQLDRIFDPFYSEKNSGRGLGLSSLSGIVRQHGGFIHVNTAPGQGSCFTIYFPIVAWHAESGVREVDDAPVNKASRHHVLVAEDDSRIRSLVRSILEIDYMITTAEDGEEALNLFEDNPAGFDLLVLDCTMPKLLGTEMYQQVRDKGLPIPIILISGYDQEQVIKDISKDTAAYFIKKPFNVEDLIEHVSRALGEQDSPVQDQC